MLTIKFVDGAGYEAIEEVESVELVVIGGHGDSVLGSIVDKELRCYREGVDKRIPKNIGEDSGYVAFNTGTVYVMNRFGKTVAVYHLGFMNQVPPPVFSRKITPP